MKGVGRRFGLAPSGCRRPAGPVAAQAIEGGRRPPGGPTWGGVDRELGQRGKSQGK
jgi:hypothetical protein